MEEYSRKRSESTSSEVSVGSISSDSSLHGKSPQQKDSQEHSGDETDDHIESEDAIDLKASVNPTFNPAMTRRKRRKTLKTISNSSKGFLNHVHIIFSLSQDVW